MPRALITGITGQDGSYLAEFLLQKGYEVHGIIRRASTFNTQRIDHIYEDPLTSQPRLHLYYGDILDSSWMEKLLRTINPDEIYHLAAQSHVKVSFDLPLYTAETTAIGTLRVLEALRSTKIPARFYQATSSEIFGSTPPPQCETSPFHPRSPYAISKLFAYFTVINYREAYGIFASNGILFNHESPRRGETFVSRKITRGFSRILAGKDTILYLGNLEARRDFGYAPEYVETMWRMLQLDNPVDLVIGTGESHSVKEFVEEVSRYLEIEIEWKGEGVESCGFVRSYNPRWSSVLKRGQKIIATHPRYFRPLDVENLCADYRKARELINFEPRIRFTDLIKIMVDNDLHLMGITPPGAGFALDHEMGFRYTHHRVSITSQNTSH